jgi:hypothetical protein
VFLHLSYGKELPEKISEFIDRADHRKTGVENRVLSLHRNQATHNIDHGAHFIFDPNAWSRSAPFIKVSKKSITHKPANTPKNYPRRE